jgi:pyruvate/2-oxoglutarate dehydrogenase complex dihydrolipoamide acyltransferase (E2) component
MTQSPLFQTIPFPSARRMVVDAGYLAHNRHIIYGFLEIDVTIPKSFIRDYKTQMGETISFTGYLVMCLAHAIKAHPMVQAYRGWRGHLVIYNAVDVVTLIEAEQGGVAIPHIIRNADQKSLLDIHQEIRDVQHKRTHSPQRTKKPNPLLKMPRFMRIPLTRLFFKNPHAMKKYAGTVVITSVGMFGKSHGWGVGFLSMHTTGLTVGGISSKPMLLINGEWVNRDILCLTLAFDHDVVDGAPASRFAKELVTLLESGFGLPTS